MSTVDANVAQAVRPARIVLPLVRNPTGAAGFVLVITFLVLGVIGLVMLLQPQLADTWQAQDLANALQGPLSSGHVLGTDPNGRDLLARIIVGIGVSFLVAFAVTAVSLLVGVTVGLVAGYYRGRVDTLIRGVIDVTWGFPIILLAVMLAGMIRPGLATVVLAVALLSWAGIARVIRGYALSLREREFIAAANAIGIPTWRIIWTHLLPNVAGPILVLGSYTIAVTIVIEAGLSFLGLGVQAPVPSLGGMLAEGRNFLRLSSWQTILPGLAIVFAVLGFNLLGDGLRDLLDPRLSRPQA